MATVEVWAGVEAKALRKAKRMSIEAFAAHLGISDRMVSKWEARGTGITPRLVNQAALETSLAASGPEVHERFVRLAGTSDAVLSDQRAEAEHALPRQHQITHPGDGKRMALVETGVHLAGPRPPPSGWSSRPKPAQPAGK
ncbi:helix-turn-helix transcriptional regulator [Kitasatospora sp. NPDC088351]